MNRSIGLSKQELIMKLGPPSRTASDGGDGEILVYARQVHIAGMPASSIYSDNATEHILPGTPSRTYWQYTMFYLNNEGKVYHWLRQNQQVPPQQIDLNLYIRK